MKSDRCNRGIYLTKLVFYADHLCWQLQTVYKLPVATLVAIRYSHASLLFGGSVTKDCFTGQNVVGLGPLSEQREILMKGTYRHVSRNHFRQLKHQ